MNWKVPNQLTVGRIGLAAAFFALVGVYLHGSENLLKAAIVVYLIAGITDILDGYLARKLNITSAFGRIVDPFVDKVLVVGAFAMLAGPNFAYGLGTPLMEQDLPAWLTGRSMTAVQPWMVVVILAREFVVSAVRGYSESLGIKFPATAAGKVKMFVQSAAICGILVQLVYLPETDWAIYGKIALVWLSVIVTVVSAFHYVGKARKILFDDESAA
ncbi:MAG: CDP-alcohol phosphatidyltransferase family protein [Planctomycetota bacterium]|nr:CDP-alcohol phosphatidyltransferase family protein [Planctomycetota bacterium]